MTDDDPRRNETVVQNWTHKLARDPEKGVYDIDYLLRKIEDSPKLSAAIDPYHLHKRTNEIKSQLLMAMAKKWKMEKEARLSAEAQVRFAFGSPVPIKIGQVSH